MPDFLRLDPPQEAKARDIHAKSIIVDGLCYMTAPEGEEYVRTLIQAGIAATNVTVPEILDDLGQTVRRVADWYASFATHKGLLVHAQTVDDIHKAKEQGRTAIIMGFQDTKPIGNELKLVDVFQRLGIRIIQLTYQHQNSAGGGCGETDAGLSSFGRDLVKRLNELGILVDLSHCGAKTTMDVVRLTTRPVAFTHAGILALRSHVRNKSDDLIKAVAETGGLIGLPSYSQFLDIRDSRKPSIIEYLDAIEYAAELTGIDHVALGFDFTPSWTQKEYEKSARMFPEIYLDFSYEETSLRGLRGAMDAINVTRGLVLRGYSELDIRKVLGENFLRVFAAAWN